MAVGEDRATGSFEPMNITTIPAMRTEDVRFKAGQHLLEGTRVLSADESLASVISFHGMGAAATRHRIRYLLDDLARSGVSSACVDFSGHGDSSGQQETA